MSLKVTTTILKEHKCPGCGSKLTAASGFNGASPSPGDITICGYCASVLRFGEGLKTTLLEKETWDTELDEVTREEIQRMVFFVKHKLSLRPHHQN